jgi:hypothetical protein
MGSSTSKNTVFVTLLLDAYDELVWLGEMGCIHSMSAGFPVA